MIRLLCSFVLAAMCAAFVSDAARAEDFVPHPLEIEAELLYNSDELIGNPEGTVTIRVGVHGHDAIVIVAFKDEYADDNHVDEPLTGNLGWRYINKIDTFSYFLPPHFIRDGATADIVHHYSRRTPGPGSVKNNYAIWAYSTGGRQRVFSEALPDGGGTIITRDHEDTPLAQPLYYSAPWNAEHDISNCIHRERRVIGGPVDAPAFGDQTWYTGEQSILNDHFEGVTSWRESAPFIPSPYHSDEFYAGGYGLFHGDGDDPQPFATFRRYQWRSGREAVYDSTWADNGELRIPAQPPGVVIPDVAYIDDGMLVVPIREQSGGMNLAKVDAGEGYVIVRVDQSGWWDDIGDIPGDGYAPERLRFGMVRGDPRLVMASHLSRLLMIIDPHDANNDWLRVINTLPEVYEPPLGVERPAQDGGSPAVGMDRNGFMFYPVSGYDGKSFGMLSPTGKPLGFFPFAGDIGYGANELHVVDYGSAYDGFYFDSRDPGEPGLWYVPFATITRRIIIYVDIFGPLEATDSSPGTFSLSPAHPNPFNPVTTIPFSLSREATVTIDILNTAGTVVATLTDRAWTAGAHDIRWDASGMASGIYFCRMRAAEFSDVTKILMVK